MTQTFDDPDGPSQRNSTRNDSVSAAADARPRILVVDSDRPLLGLLEEWLGAAGCAVESEPDGGRFALVIVDLPHPRRGGAELLRRLAQENPGAPIIALSSTFFSGIESTGGVARTLGVACVLPKPVGRESLITAVRSLLRR
jgi:DNA-binding response OmpR family regulator